MTIPNGGLPKVGDKILAKAAEIVLKRRFQLKDHSFSAKFIPIGRLLFERLGFNCKFFKPGVVVYLLDKASYERFSKACNIEAPDGFYPLPTNGDDKALLRGEIDFLPNCSRRIILSDDYKDVALIHELLHDIFIGGGLSPKEREEFTKNILHWFRLSIDPNMPHQHKNHSFYEEVARICMKKFRIENVNPHYCMGHDDKEPDFKVFAAECFAYAGEFMLHPQGAQFSEIPKEIQDQLMFLRLFDRSRLQHI